MSSGQSNPEFEIHILSTEIHILFILWDLMNICKQNKTDIHNSYPAFEMPLTRSSNCGHGISNQHNFEIPFYALGKQEIAFDLSISYHTRYFSETSPHPQIEFEGANHTLYNRKLHYRKSDFWVAF